MVKSIQQAQFTLQSLWQLAVECICMRAICKEASREHTLSKQCALCSAVHSIRHFKIIYVFGLLLGWNFIFFHHKHKNLRKLYHSNVFCSECRDQWHLHWLSHRFYIPFVDLLLLIFMFAILSYFFDEIYRFEKCANPKPIQAKSTCYCVFSKKKHIILSFCSCWKTHIFSSNFKSSTWMYLIVDKNSNDC